MWITDKMQYYQAVFSGEAGTEQEQHDIREYLSFYGYNSDGYHYSLPYQNVIGMMNGTKRNTFIAIWHIGANGHTDYLVYAQQMEG